MVPISWAFLLFVFLGLPLALIVILKSRVRGKVLAWILEEDRTITVKLLPRKGDFAIFKGDYYLIDEEYTRTIWYPSNLPVFLQNQVPVLLLETGRAEPLRWTELQKKGLSPKELGDVLDPQWMGHLIKGAGGQPVTGGMSKLFSWLLLGGLVVSLLLIFALFFKMGSLEGSIGDIKGLLK